MPENADWSWTFASPAAAAELGPRPELLIQTAAPVKASPVRKVFRAGEFYLKLDLRQGNRLTLRQPLQSGSHLLQNSAIDAATAERQGRNSAVKRPLAKGVLQLKYRLRQLLAIVTIRLVCLQQGRQLVAAQSGGQPRAPGLGIGGDLRCRPAGLGE